MRASRLVRAGTIVPLVLAFVAGCDDAAGPGTGAAPGTGAISVSVTTTGVDLDLDGYTVSVDGVAARVD